MIFSRSWREFKKNQAVGLLSLYKKVYQHNPIFHFNINGYVSNKWLEFVYDFIPKESITLYNDDFFDEYAIDNGVDVELIKQFPTWKWIYHILLYHYLYYEKNINHITTYDDDILFNESDIDYIVELIKTKKSFGIGEINIFSDKTLLGALSIYFKDRYDINYLYWKVFPQYYSINSGFMGFDPSFFDKYESLNNICNFFNYEHFSHMDINFDNLFNKLIQEQSFLAINAKCFNNEFITLEKKNGYNINWNDIDDDYPSKTKIEHYISSAKYENVYKNRVREEFKRFREMINQGLDISKFYET